MSEVRNAALMAATMYLKEGSERNLTTCIAAGANKYGVEWKAVANYLSGVGVRAILSDEQRCALMVLHRAGTALCNCNIDWGGVMAFADTPVPNGSVNHKHLWDIHDAMTVMDNAGFFEDLE